MASPASFQNRTRRLGLLIALLFTVPFAGAVPRAAAEAPIHGIDVSGHSGEVDWPRLAEDFAFAFVKATEGVDLTDPSFSAHWPAMAEAGIVRGAYHFFVTEDDPIAQAEFFLQTVPFAAGDLVPVVDLELIGHGTKAGLAQRLKVWLDHVEAALGVKPIIYTSPRFWDLHLDSTFGDYPLWVAEYGVDEPAVPQGWATWNLWQWRGDADVVGVEKGADLSRLHPTATDLDHLIIPAISDPATSDHETPEDHPPVLDQGRVTPP